VNVLQFSNFNCNSKGGQNRAVHSKHLLENQEKAQILTQIRKTAAKMSKNKHN
jgi:hypothetical protein